ncbi:extracellular solute-binding protein (plasmid) [Skermanella rosea]|uniref:extracellular solute-binding protein n=1 Tax=Skermanella rosea TaxID=1817965 RepID=UPI001931AE95|nr:extracellular solute-binding protein [Skermanella rosea]UEM07887.1 extracellular solute-binding protein [Skermanella rosea]
MASAAEAGSTPGLSRLFAIGEGDDGQYPIGFQHFEYVNPNAPKSGTLRLSQIGSFSNLQPFSIRPCGAEADLLYDRLFVSPRDDPLTAYPLVARSVAIADDRSSAVFTLNPLARWHDGSPVTAEDVVFTYELLTSSERALPYFRIAYKDVTGAEAIDPLSVKFSFVPENAQSTVFMIASMHVLPKHYYTERKFGTDTLEPPLGSGPYRIEQVLPGRRIVYRRVADYWAQNLPVRRGMYNFDTWTVDYYRDVNARSQAFMAGLIDMVVEFNPARWSLYDGVPDRSGLPVVKAEAPLRGALGSMNFVFNLRRPPFDDRLVREAVTQLFDHEWINRVLQGGWTQRNYSQFPNSDLAAAGKPTPAELTLLLPWKSHLRSEILEEAYLPPAGGGSGYQRDARREAFDLFGKAGYHVRDGLLVDGTGRQLSIEIMTAGPESRNVLLAFVASLRRAGIDARLRLVETAQFEQRSRSDFDFDMAFQFSRSTDLPGPEMAHYWGSPFANERFTVNVAGVQDPVVDDLVARIGSASSREDLIAASRALDRVLMWNAYILPGWYIGTVHYAYWDRLSRPARMAGSAVPDDVGWPAVETWWEKQ